MPPLCGPSNVSQNAALLSPHPGAPWATVEEGAGDVVVVVGRAVVEVEVDGVVDATVVVVDEDGAVDEVEGDSVVGAEVEDVVLVDAGSVVVVLVDGADDGSVEGIVVDVGASVVVVGVPS